jgi:hypothetical protein
VGGRMNEREKQKWYELEVKKVEILENIVFYLKKLSQK